MIEANTFMFLTKMLDPEFTTYADAVAKIYFIERRPSETREEFELRRAALIEAPQ